MGLHARACFVFCLFLSWHILTPSQSNAISPRTILGLTGASEFAFHGRSVALAGDVNGDGYADVMVGAPSDDSGGVASGRAYVYFGGRFADDEPDWVLTGEGASDFFGWSVDGAGDVNGDGFDDVLVGAYAAQAGGTSKGRAYLFYGGVTPDDVADLTLSGVETSDRFGWAVSGVGDLTGDDYADFVVAAPLNDRGGAPSDNVGAVYLFLGSAVPNTTPIFSYFGEAIGDNFGHSVGRAGDVDGDGFPDIAVGAPFNGAGGTNAGRAYIHYGGISLDNVADRTFTGGPGNKFGWSVDTAGDMNGDGHDDVVVGAIEANTNGTASGDAIVFFGGPGGDELPDLTISGTPGDALGVDVGSAGDVNSDGYGDIIVGATGHDALGLLTGRAYVYYGGAVPDATPEMTITGEAAGDVLGISVGLAGDVDGDGHDDVIVGAYQNDEAGLLAGKAYVITSRPFDVVSPNGGEEWIVGTTVITRWLGADLADISVSFDGGASWSTLVSGVGGDDENAIEIIAPSSVTSFALVRVSAFGESVSYATSDASDAVFRIAEPAMPPGAVHRLQATLLAEDAGDFLGGSVANAGDVNGDGHDDLIVGAQSFDDGDGFQDVGRAYVLFGGPPFDMVPDLTLTGQFPGEEFGTAVSGAGDITADGYADIIVGAPKNDQIDTEAGAVYVFYGGPTPDATADLTLFGESALDHFGGALGSAGDMNGDGFADIIIGAPDNDAGAINAGRAYLYFGGAGMNPFVDRVFTGHGQSDAFGFSCRTAGDLNSDGYEDLVIGAWSDDAGEPFGTDFGRAYVYFGSLLADTIPDLVVTGNPDDFLGTSVAAAGDFNDDGHDDLVVGARRGQLTAGSLVRPGRAYVYFGGPTLNATANLIFIGELGNEDFGASVSSAGDVNGDGVSDILVGSPGRNIPTNAGRAYVFFGGAGADALPDITIDGAAFDRLGVSVAGAGDVNGDGVSDLLIGAYQNNTMGNNAGAAYLYDCARFLLLEPNGGEVFIAGEPVNVRWLGGGPADLALSIDSGLTYVPFAFGVGGTGENEHTITLPPTATDAGRIRVSASGELVTRASSDESEATFRIVSSATPSRVAERIAVAPTGEASADIFGTSVRFAGDVDGDGQTDVIVGAPNNDAVGAEAGRAYVYFLGAGRDSVPDIVIDGEAAGDALGSAVAAAGDINGDGHADVIVGAPNNDAVGADAGRAYLHWGGPGADGVPDLTLSGASEFDRFGGAVAPAGDFDADGYMDVIVGAERADDGSVATGRAYLYRGGPALDALADVVFAGEASGDAFGFSVALAGDVNGDGSDDLIIGAYLNGAPGLNAGRAYMYFGGLDADSSADVVLDGEAAGDGFGRSVAPAGDVNGDGFDDVIVGAFSSAAVGPNGGRAYVFYGGPDLDGIADLVLTAEAAGDLFGVSVSGAGDVNGDGFDDVIVGGERHDTGGDDRGRAYVFYGGVVPDAVPDIVLTGEAAGDLFGGSVHGGGDVSGDGLTDVVVGAPFNDASGLSAGRVFVYDVNRFHVVSPGGGETWPVGALRTIEWLGQEQADIWLSPDGGNTYELIRERAGGAVSNSLTLRVPHLPTRFGTVRVTPSDLDALVVGQAESDSLFTIEMSVSLLVFRAVRVPDRPGAVEISWETDPGPEDLAGYRLERSAGGGWETIVPITPETSHVDGASMPGARYRVFSRNGLGDELLLGEIAAPVSKPLSAWPLPHRGGTLNVGVVTFGGTDGGAATADIRLFDLAGRHVRTLFRGALEPGRWTFTWDGRDEAGHAVASGVYFLQANVGGERRHLKLVVAP